MLARLIAGALSAPLGAPGVVYLDQPGNDTTSAATNGGIAGFVFSSTGSFYKYLFDVPIEMNYWLSPIVDMDDYEIRATKQSGDDPDVGSLSTWENLGTTRQWLFTAGTTQTCVLRIEIRWTGNNVVQDTADYTMSVSA